MSSETSTIGLVKIVLKDDTMCGEGNFFMTWWKMLKAFVEKNSKTVKNHFNRFNRSSPQSRWTDPTYTTGVNFYSHLCKVAKKAGIWLNGIIIFPAAPKRFSNKVFLGLRLRSKNQNEQSTIFFIILLSQIVTPVFVEYAFSHWF